MMPNDGTVYRPLGYTYGLEVPPGGGGGVESGRGQVQTMRTEWWWQPGPVTSCCWFFSLRTGVYLLALWNMLSGYEYLRMEKTKIPWMIERLAHDRKEYKTSCGGHVVEAQSVCDAIVENIAYFEKVLDFWQSSIPTYHVIGALFMLFALVGWRAGYTSSPAVAKVFMMAFPAALSLRIALIVLSPQQTLSFDLFVLMVMFAYFFKVAWSFYARVTMLEEANRLADEMDPPRPVNSTRGDANDPGFMPLDASSA